MTPEDLKKGHRRELETALGLVPDHMADGLREYVETGRPPGDFLREVLSNNLFRAAAYADPTNASHLSTWGRALQYLPPGSWGSPAAVARWIDGQGLKGSAHLPEGEQ